MRPRSIPRFIEPVSNVLLPMALVLLILLMGAVPAHASPDGSAAADVALSASAAQRATQVSGAAPVLDPPSGMTVLENQTADQALHATDAQGDPLTFSKAFGPAYMTVTTTNPGNGSATGNIHLAPGTGTMGTTQASVSVTDGVLSDQGTFLIQVSTPQAPPVLDPIADATVPAGSSLIRPLHAADSNGDELTFYLAAGPSYATVSTDDGMTGQGSLRLSPSFAVSGSATVRVGVSDGIASDEKSLNVTVTRVEVAPVLAQPTPVNLRGGEVRNVGVNATDANGDPVTFSKVSGPAYMAVTTDDPGHGSAFGTMHFNPIPSLNDTATAIVSATDGELSSEKAFLVSVRANTAPVLDPVFNIQMSANDSTTEYVSARDFETDGMTLTIASGPSYASIFTYYEYPGYIYAQVGLHPTSSDVGLSTVVIRASDGILFDEKSFTVNVVAPGHPTLSQPVDMAVTTGEVGEQTVTATDPDGRFTYIYKSSGPSYMTVSSNGNYGSTSAVIRLLPGAGDVGNTIGAVTATDNFGTDTKSFAISVQAGNFPPPCPPNTFSVVGTQFGYGTLNVQSADLNADGALDIVVEMPDAQRLVTALGVGDGTFSTTEDLDAGSGPYSAVVVDLNRDEIPDLAVTNYYASNISIYLGSGAGGFGSRRNFQVGGSPQEIVAADVNRDGKMDLLVANGGTPSVSLLRGVGDGTFLGANTLAPGAYLSDLAAPDLNGDGAPDLVIVNQNENKISVFLNNGAGAFGARVDYPTPTYPFAIAAGDVNVDGKADLVVSSYFANAVSVFLGDGTGVLAPRRTFSTHFSPERVAIADVNGDGHPDIATTNLNSNDVSILLGDGSGGFAPHTDVPAGSGTYGLATGDFDDDLRMDLAVTDYYDGTVQVLLNNGCAPDLDHPPVVKAPKTAAGSEGSVLAFSVSAGDPDGPSVATLAASFAGLPLGNNAAFVANGSNSAGTFTWTPTFMDARPTPYPVTFTATNVLSGAAMTKITVTNVNRAPHAAAGGPYTAFSGTPIQFDGRASSDPDGDVLLFTWVFGDGASGTGAQPQHAYAAIGVYGIALTVSDGALTSLVSTTTANVVGLFQARAFTASGNRNIRLGAGKPQWCVQIEAIARSFANETVDMTSLVMKSTGTGSVDEIHAITGKSTSGGDKDGNGVEELDVCFSKTDLRLLFSNVHGNGSATVAFEGNLYTGGRFRATMDVGVIAGGGNLAAAITPNPLNPSATMTYFTTRSGSVSLQFFDPHGRLIRTVFRESRVEPGYHDVPLDGRDDRGVPLASGVYYYRLHADEGTSTGRFTVLR